MKKKKGVISDPCKDAEERYAQKFRVVETIGALDDAETYYTTSDFQNLAGDTADIADRRR